MKREYLSFLRYTVVGLVVAACAGLRTLPANRRPAPEWDTTGEGYALTVAYRAEFLTQDRVPRGWWEPTDPYTGPYYYLVATGGEICRVADAGLWTMAIEQNLFTCAWRHPHGASDFVTR